MTYLTSLQEALSIAAREVDCSFRQRYSGRGMYGQTCVGVAGSRRDINSILTQVILNQQAVVIEAALEVNDNSSNDEIDAVDEMRGQLEEQMETLMDYSRDSVALDIIIYWPALQWQGEPESDE